MVQVTYQKNNGTIFKRYRYTAPSYKIGERTSMGWILLNVEYEYKGNYYSEYEYNRLIQKNISKSNKKILSKNLCIKEIKNFLYCVVAVIGLKYLKILLGI